MPLDGHSYLVSQGWSGQGTGLRQGSIIRPLAIPQKRTLTGLGKDRDEAFPFWDHLFSVAAKTIQVKISTNDSDSDSDSELTDPKPSLDRTNTGILSNRPPRRGTPAAAASASISQSTSGTNTPSLLTVPSSNLLVTAKREAAKQTLYARFFRGPVLGPEIGSDPSSSGSASGASGRNTRDISEWDEVIQAGISNGSRTPMAMAKAKIATASEPLLVVQEVLKEKETGSTEGRRKRKRDEEEIKDEKKKKKRTRQEQEKRDKKARKRDKKAEKCLAMETEEYDDQEKDMHQVHEKLRRSEEKKKRDKGKHRSTSISEKDCNYKKKTKKTRTEKTNEKIDQTRKNNKERKEGEEQKVEDYEHRNHGGEDEDEYKRRKRERRQAKKAAAAAVNISHPQDSGVDMVGISSNLISTTAAAHSQDAHQLERKKNKRKRA